MKLCVKIQNTTHITAQKYSIITKKWSTLGEHSTQSEQ